MTAGKKSERDRSGVDLSKMKLAIREIEANIARNSGRSFCNDALCNKE